MKMPGGGPHKGIEGGQITDDSEMAMCLIEGLLDSKEKEKGVKIMNLEKIVNFYKQWLLSPPFDIGLTTQSALNPLRQDSQTPV